MKANNRLNNIAEYHFKRIEELKHNLQQKGRNIFDFGIGDPDLPVDAAIIEAMFESTKTKGFNKYPPYDGIMELKLSIIKYYREVYGVKLDTDEVVVLIGSKEGINNIIPAVCDFGDTAIIPVPSYPVYGICARLWGVETFNVELKEKNDYLPRLDQIPEDIVQRSRLFFINYPNNPTGATANADFYRDIKKFCNSKELLLCNDGAYGEIININDNPLSILQGSTRENCIEFGTLSKTFNMTGFRIGYAVGDARIIRALLKIKTNVDSGQFMPIQHAAVRAFSIDRRRILEYRNIYDDRREHMENILSAKGIKFFKAKGTFYVWCTVPKGYTTDSFCEELLGQHGIVVTPGYTFGSAGEGYFRIALTKDIDIIREAFDKINVYN